MMICTRSAEVDAEAALKDYVKALQDAGYLKEVLALGPHKCLAICQLAGKSARRLDLLVTPPESFACSVFYFTGSDGFNVAVRALAKEKGFTLNEHGLFRGGSSTGGVAVAGLKTERDIFTALGLQWKEPAERTGPEACVLTATASALSSNSSSSSSSSSSASGRVATMPKGSLRMSTAAAILVSSMWEEDYENDDSDDDYRS
jgi:hypothetical protein